VSRGPQGLGERERKQNYRQHQWSERNQNQINSLIAQVHEDGGDD